ncbi:MAG: glycosyltransferase [Chloroflexi bacterium]|nr:glycosyltransferase [Chloroflexota bacterium]
MNDSVTTRICVVGSSTRFLSGISYYTLRLANTLADAYDVSAILMRQLLPTFAYPGRTRVGARLTDLTYRPTVRVLDGVDWFWLPSMWRAFAMMLRERPHAVVLQWWTATVVHSYLALALIARALGARVVVEFHEVLDPGEAGLRPVRMYVGALAPLLVRLADAFVIHSEHDRALLEKHYGIADRPIATIPHGPYDHYSVDAATEVRRSAPESTCNLLYFGVIRPYKGLEDLIRAFEQIPEDQIHRFWLTVVGETWEGWTLPSELIARSRYYSRITFVNRYVPDQEVAGYFAGADAVVLPYLRSSASGPLHVAMSQGLPVVVTHVGGLVEAVNGYSGAILVPPSDPVRLRGALFTAESLRGQHFPDPHSWERNALKYSELFESLLRETPRLTHVVAPGRLRP